MSEARFIDLHCHWLPGVDDGVQSLEEGVQLLQGLGQMGFHTVMATPHMRPGLFDNTAERLREQYTKVVAQLQLACGLPELGLSCEHYFDEVVFQRLLSGDGLPYPGGQAVLLEFYESRFPPSLDQLLAKLVRIGLMPVIAHPERYRALWGDPLPLERLNDLGAVALLDLAALVGKYGRQPQRCARELLEQGLYTAACSDAHHPRDLDSVQRAMQWIVRQYGREELHALLFDGPRRILAGQRDG